MKFITGKLKKLSPLFFSVLFLCIVLNPAGWSAETLKIIAVGDAGSGSPKQKKVANAMAAVAERESISFVLYLGDNFYIAGVESVDDEQWQRKFEKVYRHDSLQIPFYAVLGNHDYGKDPEAQVEYTKKSKRWKMPDRYYTFTEKLDDGTEIQFFALDTNLMFLRKSKRRKQLEWLEEQLAGSQADWKIVYAHHPIYSGGKHGDDEKLDDWIKPLLIEHEVDLYISGHDHVLEALKPSFGVYYLISGTGSGPTRIKQGPRDLYAKSALGFALLKISKEKIEVEIINGKNEELLYQYSIPKIS